ncbi:DUF2878 domain-containing protein [Geoalkalibacter halelectricus]|uniref:DUF2878 domain-containing protein n=1 Tax=Geoalkalibacter halelectricus TaxID=2847045 RepID=A0ABY5ZKX1_9BACT|nr:DUF2878 domain-containing protein [Geoalkalibacter halelectricus]MDO3379789.1 DUF2878 domain-containing protein [Geoalkalibacter halelectricus]UWZ79223.1 DUF2878 domain-containing protein [Geoalkalibacter halelectricus]
MLTGTASKLLNVALYQLGWWFCVLGAAWGAPLVGAGLALLPLTAHLLLADSPKPQAALMSVACLIGFIVDSLQQLLGVMTFRPDSFGFLGGCRTIRAEAKIWMFESGFWLL